MKLIKDIVQEIRAGNAARFADAQSKALQQARENELSSLTARPGGLTQEQINKKQFENSQRIYAMENDPARIAILKQIRDKQDDIYNKEEEREKALDAIRVQEDKINKIQVENLNPLEETISKLTYRNSVIQTTIDKLVAEQTELGKTQKEWDAIKSKIDADALAAKDFDKELGALLQQPCVRLNLVKQLQHLLQVDLFQVFLNLEGMQRELIQSQQCLHQENMS